MIGVVISVLTKVKLFASELEFMDSIYQKPIHVPGISKSTICCGDSLKKYVRIFKEIREQDSLHV